MNSLFAIGVPQMYCLGKRQFVRNVRKTAHSYLTAKTHAHTHHHTNLAQNFRKLKIIVQLRNGV